VSIRLSACLSPPQPLSTASAVDMLSLLLCERLADALTTLLQGIRDARDKELQDAAGERNDTPHSTTHPSMLLETLLCLFIHFIFSSQFWLRRGDLTKTGSGPHARQGKKRGLR
jgi:hypothetical protein